MMRSTVPVSGSTSTMPPFNTRGAPGNVVMAFSLLVYTAIDALARRSVFSAGSPTGLALGFWATPTVEAARQGLLGIEGGGDPLDVVERGHVEAAVRRVGERLQQLHAQLQAGVIVEDAEVPGLARGH